VGWYGFGNVGDDLLLKLLTLRLRPSLVFSTTACVVDGVSVHHVDTLLSREHELDLVILGGGGLLNDRFMNLLPLERLSIDYGLLALGAPRRDWLGGLGSVLAGARFISLRDHLTMEMVRARYPKIETWWLPDPAFLLAIDRIPSELGTVGGPAFAGERPRIVLVPRDIPSGWLRNTDPPNAVEVQIEALRRVVGLHAGRIDFLAVGFERRDAAVVSELGCPYRIADVASAMRLIAGSAGVIAARLHAGIIAAATGTPFALIDYQDKMRGLARLLDCEHRCFKFEDLDRIEPFVREHLAAPDERVSVSAPRAYGELVERVLGWLQR
jgi:polysaccharide pyruvyl transferase WcaK-like protein